MRPPLADAIFWIAVACCVVAQVAILRSTLAARRLPADAPAALPPLRRGIELLWAALPAVGLALLLVLTWRAIHPARVATPPAPAGQPTVQLPLP